MTYDTNCCRKAPKFDFDMYATELNLNTDWRGCFTYPPGPIFDTNFFNKSIEILIFVKMMKWLILSVKLKFAEKYETTFTKYAACTLGGHPEREQDSPFNCIWDIFWLTI